MKSPGLISLVMLCACASTVAAAPVPYAALDTAGKGAAPSSLQLNNAWGMRQDPARPWKGTPRGDGYDGANFAGEATFADSRWSARAIAIELRDDYAAGAHTPRALGERLAAACMAGSGAAACPSAAAFAAAIADGAGRSPAQDAGLFTSTGEVGPTLKPVMRALARREFGPANAPSDAVIDAGVGAVAYDRLDQSREGYERWRAGAGRGGEIARFQAYLSGQGLGDVFPIYQILRTASDWKGCGAPFDVPPDEDWPHIASTLRLVAERVKPAVPGLEARSSYRGPWLNVCTGGAERSAHREFWALDLTPPASMTRGELMARLCPLYASVGAERNMALGFYGGVRFHIDTRSHRSWASYNGKPYGPCAADGSVNAPPDTPPPTPVWPPPPAPR